jgi:HEAT repeat protein
MPTPAEIPFQQLLDALLDTNTPFNPRYLYRLSDLDGGELAQFKKIWPKIPPWRKQALIEDLETLGESDLLLSFEAVCSFALHDDEPKVRLPAVRALWEYEQPDLIPDFLEILTKDSQAEVRAAAATALGHYVYLGELEEISPEVLRVIEDQLLQAANQAESTLVRRMSLEALGYSSREEVPPMIEAAYASGNKDWIASALFAMGHSADERWEPQVLAMLENSLPSIRLEAARAAGELEIHQAVPELLDLLDDPDQDVHDAAVWSLSQIGGEGVRETLEQMYEETDDDDEADYLSEALDNLAFTEDMQLYTLFNIPEDGKGSEDEGDEEHHHRRHHHSGDFDDLEDEDEFEFDLSDEDENEDEEEDEDITD